MSGYTTCVIAPFPHCIFIVNQHTHAGRLTFNEPKNFCFLGYATGVMAPFLKDASGAAGWQCSLHVLQARFSLTLNPKSKHCMP